jgi:very-short-patch-repair endonuclease
MVGSKRKAARLVWPLLFEDARDEARSDRLDIGDVGHFRIGHDRRRVRIDDDDPVAFAFQRLDRLASGIVELGRLADDDRPGADDQWSWQPADVGPRLTAVARSLRRRSTEAEQRLWHHLRASQLDGAKFVRQFPIGPHVADFACRDARLVIELDGGQHSPEIDAQRTQVIEYFGYRIIRFWNNDVLQNTDGVLEAIRRELLIARNSPLP